MTFIDLAKKRCSVRSFKKDPVDPKLLSVILEAGRIAPTAANSQSQRVVIIEDKEDLLKLSEVAQIYGAPMALLICADQDATWKRSFDNFDTGPIDTAVVMTHMMLAAADGGLGAVWVDYFKPDKLKALFNLPSSWHPFHVLAIGVPNVPLKSPDRHSTMRLPLDKTVFRAKNFRK
ncbi:MAG: nitroreductase family protein [Erysipelotrichaceae bacterium]|nr:nitroreductase family protein [Erysipelotrichaceae bacterium]MDP3305999.1 nitroreductase family protein [Erysipelotrichaceae bacterium]